MIFTTFYVERSQIIVTKVCLQCEKEFSTHQCQINRGGGKFCSISCGTTYRNIHNNPTLNPETRKKISENHADAYWLLDYCSNGFKGIDVKSYRIKAFRYYGEKCNRCDSDVLLEVHHKNRNRKDNDITNLEVLCKKCHVEEHKDEFVNERDSVTGRFIKSNKSERNDIYE